MSDVTEGKKATDSRAVEQEFDRISKGMNKHEKKERGKGVKQSNPQ